MYEINLIQSCNGVEYETIVSVRTEKEVENVVDNLPDTVEIKEIIFR